MKGLLRNILPPPQWRLPVTILLGIFTGMGCYVFVISNAASYLSDKPETCMNCHVMTPQYASWLHSSHRRVANCNDCHVPHNNVVNKYFFKAKDGLRHSLWFTFRLEPQVIRIKSAGQKVVKDNCIRCHQPLLIDPEMQAVIKSDYYRNRVGRQCWECHRETPHGTVTSLSANPNAQVPTLSPVPSWLIKMMNEQKTKP
ncbi:MAG TPA: cytochrome c nitrite reductase small subunit [Bacteroidales bacterium]|mgnify:CR=1 FL=1|nr:cytochrome c nitrite reductase small subunit [Bacteroidales bacterium]HPT01382.1 cytochrome c nitrite reductase small subunit [Bacteroidales bacterium]